jgi:hypothetical protein
MAIKKESNDSIVFRIMRANTDKSRDEVVALLMDAVVRVPPAVTDGRTTKEKWLHTYYVYGMRKGIAGDTTTTTTRTRAPKAAKAPKSKMIKVPAPRIAGDREKSGLDRKMTVEEMNDIKAKNMARMKAVAAKYAKGQYAEPRFSDEPFDTNAVPKLERELDSFDAPAFLKMKDIKALV